MKKYLFILLMLLSATCMFGETKALIVSTIALSGRGTIELNSYLSNGWKVIQIERGSGNDSNVSYWLVIIEKN